jgi:hypothetical protein
VEECERKGDRWKNVGRWEGWNVEEREVARSESEVEGKDKDEGRLARAIYAVEESSIHDSRYHVL